MMNNVNRALVIKHIERHVGKIHTIFGEIVSDNLHIDVCHVKASMFRRYEVLVTLGTSAVAMKAPEPTTEPLFTELAIILPKGWPLRKADFSDEKNYWPIRLLKDLSRFVHHNNTWFGFGHTVANAEDENSFVPYADNIKFCASVLVPSLTLGEGFWLLKLKNESENIGFLCVVPLFKDELLFKIDRGIDALLDLFDANQVSDKVDLSRKSVVSRN